MEINIQEERLKRGMSQQEFATALGLSMSTIQKWEAGNYNPSPLSLRKLSGFILKGESNGKI
jgi:transcriptional regulator with XRE-family HTH domain